MLQSKSSTNQTPYRTWISVSWKLGDDKNKNKYKIKANSNKSKKFSEHAIHKFVPHIQRKQFSVITSSNFVFTIFYLIMAVLLYQTKDGLDHNTLKFNKNTSYTMHGHSHNTNSANIKSLNTIYFVRCIKCIETFLYLITFLSLNVIVLCKE